jgi:hypothetical protein
LNKDRRLVLIAGAALLAPGALAAPRGLNGAWSGAWVYSLDPAAFRDPQMSKPFTALLRERGARFDGETDEPNTFADPRLKRLRATVAGARKDRDLSFIKTYATADVRHSVDYRGQTDRAFTKAEGIWAIGADGGLWRMVRTQVVIS